MKTLADYTPEQLEQAIALKKQIAILEARLAALSGTDRIHHRRAAKEIAASSRKVSAKKPGRNMSAAGRAKIAAAMKARWAKAKAKGKNRLS
jgi:hypothetical protein